MKGNIIPDIEAKMHMSEKKIGSESAIENEGEREERPDRERDGQSICIERERSLMRRKVKFDTQRKMNHDFAYYKLSSFEQANQICFCVLYVMSRVFCVFDINMMLNSVI